MKKLYSLALIPLLFAALALQACTTAGGGFDAVAQITRTCDLATKAHLAFTGIVVVIPDKIPARIERIEAAAWRGAEQICDDPTAFADATAALVELAKAYAAVTDALEEARAIQVASR